MIAAFSSFTHAPSAISSSIGAAPSQPRTRIMQEEPAPEVENQDLTLVPCNLRCTEATAGRLGANVPPRMSRTNPAPSAGIPLEPSADEMRALLDAVRDRVVAHVASLPAQPAADVEGAAELARDLFEPEPPEAGIPAAEILDLLFDRAIPKSFNTAGPGYLAYIPGGGVFAAALADLISDATNRYVGVWQTAPALVQLETNVVRWLCGLVGLPEGSGGYLATGGSLASFTAVVAARREKLPADFLKGTLYVSDQTHHAVDEGRFARGVPGGERPGDSVRRAVPGSRRPPRRADRRGPGGRPHAVLRLRKRRDDEHGGRRRPRALADLCARERLWLHVDGAYGGFFLLTERGRAAMAGIERADSVVLDPHKGLFLPYGTGALLVRDAEVLRRAHAAGADYLPHMQEDPGFVDICEISPELSRAFRGLRVWLPVKLHGLGAFRRNLDEKLDLALHATRELKAMPGVEIVAEPQLSIVAFRLVKPGLDARGAEPPEPRPDRAGERAAADPPLGDGPRRLLRPEDLRPLVPDPSREARAGARRHPRGDRGSLTPASRRTLKWKIKPDAWSSARPMICPRAVSTSRRTRWPGRSAGREAPERERKPRPRPPVISMRRLSEISRPSTLQTCRTPSWRSAGAWTAATATRRTGTPAGREASGEATSRPFSASEVPKRTDIEAQRRGRHRRTSERDESEEEEGDEGGPERGAHGSPVAARRDEGDEDGRREDAARAEVPEAADAPDHRERDVHGREGDEREEGAEERPPPRDDLVVDDVDRRGERGRGEERHEDGLARGVGRAPVVEREEEEGEPLQEPLLPPENELPRGPLPFLGDPRAGEERRQREARQPDGADETRPQRRSAGRSFPTRTKTTPQPSAQTLWRAQKSRSWRSASRFSPPRRSWSFARASRTPTPPPPRPPAGTDRIAGRAPTPPGSRAASRARRAARWRRASRSSLPSSRRRDHSRRSSRESASGRARSHPSIRRSTNSRFSSIVSSRARRRRVASSASTSAWRIVQRSPGRSAQRAANAPLDVSRISSSSRVVRLSCSFVSSQLSESSAR